MISCGQVFDTVETHSEPLLRLCIMVAMHPASHRLNEYLTVQHFQDRHHLC